MSREKWAVGPYTTVLSTQLNALANNANAATSTPYNNVQGGGGGDGFTLADVELVVSFAVAPTAGTAVSIWFLAAPDGSNYEDGSASVIPARTPDVVLPLRAVTGAQRTNRRTLLPWGLSHILVRNDGTGQTFAATGNTVSIRPATGEGV